MSTLLSRNIWNVDIEIAFGWHLTCCFSQLSNAACVFCICFQWQGCEPSLATHCHLSRLAGQRVRAIITKIESFQFLLLQYKWRQGDQPPPGPTQSSQRWWVSPSSRTGGLASTWATRTSSTDPEFSRCLNLKEIGMKIKLFTLLRSFMDCLFLQLWHSFFLLDSTSSSTRPLSK